jgi:aryl-alcohol dehydrogenase-like predicted oxidoreductase
MDLRPLGSTGVSVSPIGLGTTKFGRTEQLKYPEPFELPSDRQIRQLLEVAGGFGVNLIDTAPAYGTSEQRIGELLADREGWVIITKVGEEFVAGRSRFDFSPAAVRTSVERSLVRLRRDRLDIVLLHSSGDDLTILRESGAVDALMELREAGVILAMGASTKTLEGGLLAVELCDVVMVTLNRRDRSQIPVIEAADRAGVCVLIKKALASGHDRDPNQALVDVVTTRGVDSVIVGTVNSEHLAANCRAVESALAL